MKRNTALIPVLRTLLATSVALSTVACDTAADPSSTNTLTERRASERYDGRQLFEGIVLGQGEVASLLPLSWEDCERDARMDAFASLPPELMLEELDRLIERNTDDELAPALERIRERLASGEVSMEESHTGFEVLTAMVEEADPEYFDALEEAVYSGNRPAIREAVLRGFLLTKGLLTVENSVIEIGTDEDGVAVLFVAVAVVAFIVVWIEVGMPGVDQSLLQEEILVNEIAQNIAGY